MGSADDAVFSAIADIAVDSCGHIYVADRGSHNVARLSPDGVLMSKAGTQGAGPGQFLSGPRFIHTLDNRVFALEGEAGAQRVHVFDNELQHLDTITPPDHVRPTNGFVVDSDGIAILVSSLEGRGTLARLESEDNVTPVVALEAPGMSVWNSMKFDRTRAGAGRR